MRHENINRKTILCDFWKMNKCRYMNTGDCKYAHGIDELIFVECKYKNNCNNVNCVFDHGKITNINAESIEIPIKIKISNKKPQNKIYDHNNNINKLNHRKENINSYDSENGIEDDNQKMENKHYINYCNNVIQQQKEIINIKDKEISHLEMKIDKLFNSISTIRNKNIMVQNDNLELDNKIEKTKKIYKKYVNIYNIFKKYKFDYKIIKNNLKEILEYSNDKNIYKIKERTMKVYNYYNKLKSGYIKDYLPISIIIKM